MRGLMMDTPLLVSSLLRHGAAIYGDSEVVSRTVEGPIHRYGYAEAHRRSQQLANALTRLGVKLGDRVGTIAWNTYRHFEIYFGVSGMGAVCHTMNPRLHPSQILYMLDHAEDQYVFVDTTFLPLIEQVADQAKTLKGVIVLTDRAGMPDSSIDNLICYEDLIVPNPIPTIGRNSTSGRPHRSATRRARRAIRRACFIPTGRRCCTR